MDINVGSIDRVFRIVLGLGLLSLFFILDGNARWFGLVGIVLLVTALIGWCPIYKVCGTRTGR